MFKRSHPNRKPLKETDHKYSRGVVAIVAGSRKYPGAAVLTVGGARHGGAGYVKFLASDNQITQSVINRFPDVVPIPTLTRERFDVLVIGPGGAKARRLPDEIPVVLDSAALPLALRKRTGITIVTPHEGELHALDPSLKERIGDDEKRVAVAESIAKRLGLCVVLKGHHTVVASAGNTTFIDQIGGPELATAGTGDLLAGLIGSMVAHWRPSDSHALHDVICRAVQLHSKAGEYAARQFRSVTALEVMDSLRYV